MISKKLESLQKEFLKTKELSSLLIFLEEGLKEKEYLLILEMIDFWKGDKTPEIKFYLGSALIFTGEKEKGKRLLEEVIKINPHHFKAKQILKKFELVSENKDEKKILVDQKLEQIFSKIKENDEPLEDETAKKGRRNFYLFISFIFILFFVVMFFLFRKTPPNYEKQLKNPDKYFSSLSISTFEERRRLLKIEESRFPESSSIKQALFFLDTLAYMDFHQFDKKELLSEIRFYFTIVDQKTKRMQEIMNLLDKKGEGINSDYLYYLDLNYPKTLNKIKQLKILKKMKFSNKREQFYTALMFYRLQKYNKSLKILETLLNAKNKMTLADKLYVLNKISLKLSQKQTFNKSEEKKIESKILAWKARGFEKYFTSEAFVLLGKLTKNRSLESSSFYISCPGRFFCKDVIYDFINAKQYDKAANMAIYIKEQKENKKTPQDLKLVVKTTKLVQDYGNCYFSFKELQQFFPKSIDKETLINGAICSEKNGYLEDALKLYLQLEKISPSIKTKAKILALNYKIHPQAELLDKLMTLVLKNPKELEVLNSAFLVLNGSGKMKELTQILQQKYLLSTTTEEKLKVIDSYLKNGMSAKAVALVKKEKKTPVFQQKLLHIYYYNLLFDVKDSFITDVQPTKQDLELKNLSEMIFDKKFKEAKKIMESKKEDFYRCNPPYLMILAEINRNEGDRDRTLAYVDSILECNKYYLPGLVLATELSYYQGYIKKSLKGIDFILKNEEYISPIPHIYHNFVILLKAEIMAGENKEKEILHYLKKNLDKKHSLGLKEQDKLSDLYDKLQPKLQRKVEKYIKTHFRFSKNKLM